MSQPTVPLTELQYLLLNTIVNNEYLSGGWRTPETIGQHVWTFSVSDVFESKEVAGGVFSKAQVAGLIVVQRATRWEKIHGDDDSVAITELGFYSWLARHNNEMGAGQIVVQVESAPTPMQEVLVELGLEATGPATFNQSEAKAVKTIKCDGSTVSIWIGHDDQVMVAHKYGTFIAPDANSAAMTASTVWNSRHLAIVRKWITILSR